MFSFKTLYVFIVCVCVCALYDDKVKTTNFYKLWKFIYHHHRHFFDYFIRIERKKKKRYIYKHKRLKKSKKYVEKYFSFSLFSNIDKVNHVFFSTFEMHIMMAKKALLLLLFSKDNWIEKQRNFKGIVRNQI